MAVAVIETQTTASASNTTLSINTGDFTPNPSVGDLLISHFFVAANSVTITLPSGWTEIVKTENAADLITSQVAYKIADSSDATGQSLTWDKGAGNVALKLAVMRITGHRAASTITASSGTSTDSSTTITAPTVTPTDPDSMILFFTATDGASTTVASYALATSSTTFTELYEANGNNYCATAAWGVRPEITATGSGTATASASIRSIGQLVVVCAPQVITISETVTTTDTFLGNIGLLIAEVVTTTDTLTSTITRLWTKLTRNVKTWTNQNKD